jgi:hypothetical protein
MGRFVIAVCMLLCSNLACLAANKDNCTALTWTSTGIVISNPGFYCLTTDIDTGSGFTAGTAISINAPNVTLDLGGHTIRNLGAGTRTDAIGIAAQGQLHVAVRNGTLEGFKQAIYFDQNSDQLIEDIRSDSATEYAIYVNGSGAVVRRNYIVHTGGGVDTTITGAISGHGNGLRVLDNDIVDFQSRKGSFTFGINVTDGYGDVIEGNRIDNRVRGTDDVGIASYANTSDALVVNNRITGTTIGVLMLSGKYRDNLTAGVKVPYEGYGINAGNNK